MERVHVKNLEVREHESWKTLESLSPGVPLPESVIPVVTWA
jgi:hypothetical protein